MNMKRMDATIHLCIVSILIFAGILMTGAVHGQDMSWSTHPPLLFPTNEWGAITNDCQLALRVPKFEYAIGERIIAFVTIRNVDDKPLAYLYTDKYMDYEVLVASIDGQNVPYTDWWAGARNHLQPFTSGDVWIPPYQQQQYWHWLNVTELYKMGTPGTYTITIKQNLHLKEIVSKTPLRFERVGTFDILSNPVTIRILAPSSTKPEK